MAKSKAPKQLAVSPDDSLAKEHEAISPARPAPQPGSAGSPDVLDQIKRIYGMAPSEPLPATTVVGMDRFALRDDSTLRPEHELLSSLFQEVVALGRYPKGGLKDLAAGRTLLAMKPEAIGRALLAAAERHASSLMPGPVNYHEHGYSRACDAAAELVEGLRQLDFELDREGTFDLALYVAILPPYQREDIGDLVARLIESATRVAKRAPLTEGERYALSLLRKSLISDPPLEAAPTDVVTALTKLIQDDSAIFLVPGEAWSDAVNADMTLLPAADRPRWAALFRHALTATPSRPSAKWLKTAGQIVAKVGDSRLFEALSRWFALVAQSKATRNPGRYYTGDLRGGERIIEENVNCLRGLLWFVPVLPQRDELMRSVASVALSAYQKIPGVGPRDVKIGNAAIYALSEFGSKEAVGQLAMFKVRVRFGTAQKEIEKAFLSAAAALNLPPDQVEELGVPTYAMEEVGRRCDVFGDYRAELSVTGSDANLTWFDAKGAPLKSVPAKVKSEHKDDLKDLQQSLKDIQSMLAAQRDRIDGLFLSQKCWSIAEWRERYHDHPLVGTIARRLIWLVDGAAAIFRDGKPTDVKGSPIRLGKSAEVTPWHPVGRSVQEVTGWRRRLEELEITQPFKQAHREVYLLTDAERNTRTYSNRFAAHILRQHQFNALCAARGWKNKLRLMVDDAYPPATKELPLWGLRAEFWVEGIGQDYGNDTNESGVYLRLATDQVRFYRTDAAKNYAHAGGGGYESSAHGPGLADVNEPIPLEEVPPLVFSEIMRDVDLFVGVASVGNDPTWQDGGPEGRYRDYWQSYSFGELTGTATTRKQVLERLVPRLKIAKRCSFADRFLVVRGDKRTYKIHLGSGNILMEPNDQYLCIVPDAKMRASQEDLFLPFEGDATLSVIISKAMMLADDTKIKDPTITRQIDVK